MFALDEFVMGICSTKWFHAEIENDNVVIYRPKMHLEPDLILSIPKEKIQEVIAQLNLGFTFDESFLLSDKTYEVAIESNDPKSYRIEPNLRHRANERLYEIKEHNYEIYIQHASIEFVVALICIAGRTNGRVSVPVSPFFRYERKSIGSNPVKVLKEIVHVFTINISAPESSKPDVFRKLADSYLFNIAYCLSVSYRIVDFSKENYSTRGDRRTGGQLFPYREYNLNLTRYYHQAIATAIPFVKYLGFYHVAEYFFQSLSEKETISMIQKKITSPSFSPRIEEDIKALYKEIRKKLHDQRDDGVWDEKIGLLLCLRELIPDLKKLEATINQLDCNALDYYKNSAVTFADGSSTIDFSAPTTTVYNQIRNRVYSTRNAIVHSKDGEKQKYEPFVHDDDLQREIPLIRAIAEEIILNQSTVIEF